MSGLTVVTELLEKAAAVIEENGLPFITTLDAVQAAASLGSGTGAVVAHPPDTTHETWTIDRHEVTLVVISPTPDPLQAWPDLDQLLETLAIPLGVERSRLTMWQPAEGPAWPCLHITTTVTTIKE